MSGNRQQHVTCFHCIMTFLPGLQTLKAVHAYREVERVAARAGASNTSPTAAT